MTKEQYEGTPELIFYCEYNPNDCDDRLEISFTNEYKIELDFSSDENTKEICINVDLQPKESKIPKDFFGKNILNVTAIAGKNGVGKSNILKSLFINQKIVTYENLKIFMINNRYFIIEISDENNNTILQKRENNYIDVCINTDENFKKIEGEYFYPRNHNSLILGMNFYAERRKYSKSDRSQIFSRLFAEIDEVSQYLFLKNTIFTEVFFQKKFSSQLVVNEIIDFISNDKKIKCNGKEYVVTSELLHEVRTTGLMSLLWFYILFNLYVKIMDDQDSLLTDITEKFNSLSEVNEILFGFLANQEIKYVDNYPMHKHGRIQHGSLLLQNLSTALRLDSKLEVVGNDLVLEFSHQDDYKAIELIKYISLFNKVMEGEKIHISLGDYSSGEAFILEQISSLYKRFENEVRKPIIISEYRWFDSIIILIDEYEQHLHPEWSRKYLSYLLKFLDAEGERLGIKFQVVLTTHSPYLISDLPKENIILLEKNEETGKRRARKSNYGFASNYYDIMNDSFFLDDTIGEFAKQKINGCIQAINRISGDLDKLANDELILHDGLSLFIEESLEAIEEQNKIIDLVGDKFIQKQLQQLSDSVKQRLLAHSDDSVRKQQIEQDIAELEEKLRQKKMELKND